MNIAQTPMSIEELTMLTSSELLHKLEELREGTREVGYRWVAAEKAYNDLKELMPSFLAEYQAHYSGPGVNSTTAKFRALADKQYQAKVKEMNVKEYEARLIEVEYKGLMESMKALTSISYVRNQELKLSH